MTVSAEIKLKYVSKQNKKKLIFIIKSNNQNVKTIKLKMSDNSSVIFSGIFKVNNVNFKEEGISGNSRKFHKIT